MNKKTEEKQELEIKQQSCSHFNWKILGHERIGSCTCIDCEKVFGLSEAINSDHERLNKAINRVEVLEANNAG